MTDRVGRSEGAAAGALFSVRDVPPAEVTARFPLGAVVEGRIVRDFGAGRYLLSAAGLRLVAEAPDGLSEGAALRLRVRAHEPRLHLERLPDPAEAVDRALARLRLGADDETRAAVRALAARGLPIDRASIEAIRDLARAAGTAPETSALLLARGLPLRADLARAVERHLAGRPGGLRAALEGFVAAARTAGRADLAETAERALVLGAPPSAEAVRALARGHPGRLEAALARGEPPARGATESLRAALRAAAGTDDPLGRAAADLVEALETSALLASAAGEAALPLVVRGGGEDGGAEVTVARREEETVAFDLETTRLGRVRAFLLVHGGEASLAVAAADGAACDHLRAGAEEVREAFRRAGLPLASLSIEVAAPPSPGDAPAPVGFDVLA